MFFVCVFFVFCVFLLLLLFFCCFFFFWGGGGGRGQGLFGLTDLFNSFQKVDKSTNMSFRLMLAPCASLTVPLSTIQNISFRRSNGRMSIHTVAFHHKAIFADENKGGKIKKLKWE